MSQQPHNEDLALARRYGLKGFADDSDRSEATSAPAESADLALARRYGLKGFAEKPSAAQIGTQHVERQPLSAEMGDLELAQKFGLRGFERSASTTQPSDAKTMEASAAELPPVAATPTSAKLSKRSYLCVDIAAGAESSLGELEAAMGQPLASVVRGESNFYRRRSSDGSETRVFGALPLGAGGLSQGQILGEIRPGITVSLAPVPLADFQAVGSTAQRLREPPQAQAAMIRALGKLAVR